MADPHRSRLDRIIEHLRERRGEIDPAWAGTISIDYHNGEIVVKIGRSERVREQTPPALAVMD